MEGPLSVFGDRSTGEAVRSQNVMAAASIALLLSFPGSVVVEVRALRLVLYSNGSGTRLLTKLIWHVT